MYTKHIMTYLLIIILVLLGIWAAGSWFFSRVEEPVYQVVEEKNGYEIREYPAYIVAETTVVSENKIQASGNGFTIVADYIFGNNTSQEEISMTKPVVIQEGEKKEEEGEEISMTKPVLTSVNEEGNYTVGFILPSKYTLKDLPTPNNNQVTIREVPARKVAVVSFGGWYATPARYMRAEEKLFELLARDGITPLSEPVVAYYNPPMSMPFIMRNEIMIDIR